MTSDAGEGLSHAEVLRYGRHLVLPEVGPEGQQRLRGARVLLVGAGGLGSAAALYLAAAGVGCLGIVDEDGVEISNLQRQVLYSTADVGRGKSAAAADRLRALNPHLEVVPHAVRLGPENAAALVGSYDVVVDGSDNFPTRYVVNDVCVQLGKPDVYGSVYRFEGEVAVFWAARGPCYRCLHPRPPEPGLVADCATAGVLGVLPGLIGVLQAAEVLKLLLGVGTPLVGRLLVCDLLTADFRTLRLRRAADCPACGAAPCRALLTRGEKGCAAMMSEPSAPTPAPSPGNITARELHAWLAGGGTPLLLDVREAQEWRICNLPGAELMPLRTLPARVQDLPAGRDIVVYCHSGARSAQAAHFLRQHGLARVYNLRGGIDAWATDVAPEMPRY
jgi:sulfur-carrier protein adenylyltransferase/sulfurtransferase